MKRKIELLEQKESWTCSLCACAMLLNRPLEEITTEAKQKSKDLQKAISANQNLEDLSHIGYEAPGISLDELNPILFKYGYIFGTYKVEHLEPDQVKKFVKNKVGAMTVFFKHSLGIRGHAVVWDGSKIYDSGLFQIYDFDKLPEKYARPYVRQFLQLVKISN